MADSISLCEVLKFVQMGKNLLAYHITSLRPRKVEQKNTYRDKRQKLIPEDTSDICAQK